MAVLRIKCTVCNNLISKKASTCPQCGHPNKHADGLPLRKISFYLILMGGAFVLTANGGMQKITDHNLDTINKKLAQSAVQQFNMTVKTGSIIDICVQASVVEAAYLQAKDETNYQEWHKLKALACKKANL